MVSSASIKEDEIIELTIEEIQQGFETGEFTSEELTEAFLGRIEAFDPTINSLITVNPDALEIAEALDAEYETSGPRSPLHGIPIILKDNFDTFDMPTTAGSVALEGSIPPDDAFIVQKLRDAGGIILAKANMDEWAHGGSPGGGYSSLGGQTLNPYNFDRGPSGSSGGPAAAISANFGVIGLGSDTGGSIRGPSSANSLVGLKPTLGLTSRDGIIPFSLSLDTGGPFARTVEDLAISLSYITGIDPDDPATADSEGEFPSDYTTFLDEDAFEGVRIGIGRDFVGANPEIDAKFEEAIATIESLGATIVDPLFFPEEVFELRGSTYSTISDTEFKHQLADYLETTDPEYPKTLAEVIEISASPEVLNSEFPVNSRVFERLLEAEARGPIGNPEYAAAKDIQENIITPAVEAILVENDIDTLIYPTSRCPASPLPGVEDPTYVCESEGKSATNLANLSGFPDIQVPAGFISDGLPFTLSFLGLPYSEPELISYAYAFEQATMFREPPVLEQAAVSDTVPIFGSLNNDVLEAGINFTDAESLVFSGQGSDLVDASPVSSGTRIYGGSGSDELLAGSKNRVFGGEGDDLLDASVGQGENRLYGQVGNDDFFAGSNDRLNGNEGSDRFFILQGGGNVITGGVDPDQFWIATSEVPDAINTISDFVSGEDVIGIGGFPDLSFDSLNLSQAGENAIVGLDADTPLAELLGIQADSLTADDFTFATAVPS